MFWEYINIADRTHGSIGKMGLICITPKGNKEISGPLDGYPIHEFMYIFPSRSPHGRPAYI